MRHIDVHILASPDLRSMRDKYLESATTITVWVVVGSYLATVVGFAWNPTPLAEGLAAIGIAAAFAHASFAYGFRHALALFIICTAITFTMENLGAATGFPFGHYHFEVALGLPHIGAIPIVVGPLWFGMGYFSWIVAGILLGDAYSRIRERSNAILLPVVAAFVMTQWDLILEAPSATVSKAWIWRDGGAFFGVPASNFFGWLLTSWLFFQAFALYLHNRQDALAKAAGRGRAFQTMAVLFYLSAGLTHLTPWLMGTGGRGSRWLRSHLARRGHTRDGCDYNAADHGLHLAPCARPHFPASRLRTQPVTEKPTRRS